MSYALRGLQVSPETQARVQAAAEELGFRTDPIARALRGGATRSVGMVVGSLADLYLQELVAAVQRHLRAGERQLLIADADGDPGIEVELALGLADRRVDALIVSPIGPFAAGWADVAKAVPTVSIGERMPGAAIAGQVLFDHESAVRAVLEHLAERGHRRIGVLSWAIERAPARTAEQAVLEWSRRLGLETQLHACEYSLNGAQPLARDLLSGAERPTAIFALSDSVALGVYAACRELGLRIPARRRRRGLRRPAGLAPARPAAHERALAHRSHRRDRRAPRGRRQRGGGARAHGDRAAGAARAGLDRLA